MPWWGWALVAGAVVVWSGDGVVRWRRRGWWSWDDLLEIPRGALLLFFKLWSSIAWSHVSQKVTGALAVGGVASLVISGQRWWWASGEWWRDFHGNVGIGLLTLAVVERIVTRSEAVGAWVQLRDRWGRVYGSILVEIHAPARCVTEVRALQEIFDTTAEWIAFCGGVQSVGWYHKGRNRPPPISRYASGSTTSTTSSCWSNGRYLPSPRASPPGVGGRDLRRPARSAPVCQRVRPGVAAAHISLESRRAADNTSAAAVCGPDSTPGVFAMTSAASRTALSNSASSSSEPRVAIPYADATATRNRSARPACVHPLCRTHPTLPERSFDHAGVHDRGERGSEQTGVVEDVEELDRRDPGVDLGRARIGMAEQLGDERQRHAPQRERRAVVVP